MVNKCNNKVVFTLPCGIMQENVESILQVTLSENKCLSSDVNIIGECD